MGLNEVDEAFEWLNRALEEERAFMLWFKSHIAWQPLRQDPRYTELLERMGLD